MTLNEMEVELRQVSAMLAQVREERDNERKVMRIPAIAAEVVGCLFLLMALVTMAADLRHPHPIALHLWSAGLPLTLFGNTLRRR